MTPPVLPEKVAARIVIPAGDAFGKSKPPAFPDFTAAELFECGVVLFESDSVRRVEVPLDAQKRLAESVKGFGFGAGNALHKLIPHMLSVLGFVGNAQTDIAAETFSWSAWQDKRQVPKGESDEAVPVVVAPPNSSSSKISDSPPLVVGLVGLRRSGKDTAASALVADGFENVKFSGGLKHMLYAYLLYRGASLNLAERMIEGDLKETTSRFLDGRSPRHAMQTLGTEWGRELISKNIWVNTCLDFVKRHKHAVVSDVRFPNEAEALHDIGAVIVRIIRPGIAIESHPSEAEVVGLKHDIQVWNDGTIEDLQTKIRWVVNGIREGKL